MFQSMMDKILDDLSYCLIYIDDMSPTYSMFMKL